MYLVKAAVCFTVIAALAVIGRRRHHPFDRLGSANQVTMLRAGLVALIAGFLGEPASAQAATAIAGLSVIAAMLDGVDGWLARRSGLASPFGARFDMEVDALLILVLALLVWQHERAGAWVLLSGLLRYLFVVAGWLLPWMARPLPPSVRRQTICVIQIAGLILALAPAVPQPLAAPIAAISLIALTGSFLVDTVWLWNTDGHR